MLTYQYVPSGNDPYTGEPHESILLIYENGYVIYAFVDIKPTQEKAK